MFSNFTCSKLHIKTQTALIGTADGRMMTIHFKIDSSRDPNSKKIGLLSQNKVTIQKK